jgi:hypothetical protein
MTGGSQRCFHQASTLSDGTVLVTGGMTNSLSPTFLDSATLYNPGLGTWAAMPQMGSSRANHTSTVYNTAADSEVLIAGGQNGGGIVSADQFFTYDP